MGSIYYNNIKYGGGGSAEWGNINGTLSDQTDLQDALNAKQDELTEGDGIDITNTTIALDLDYLTASRVGFIPSSEKGANNGVATLGSDGKVPSGQLPMAGHDMIPVTNDIATVTALTDGDDNYVINAYTAKRWSNVDTISIFTTASQGTDTIGTWVTNWKASGASRVGWLWDSDLYGILSDDDIEIEPIYDVANSEVISIYAIRIDDDVDQTINGQTVHGGAIAFKLNNKIRSSGGVKIGINLKHQRTNVKNFTVIS